MEPGFTKAAQCNVDHATQIVVNVIVAFAVLYFLATCTLLLSKLRSYRKLPYTFVQVGLVYNTLQVRLLAPAGAPSVTCTCICTHTCTCTSTCTCICTCCLCLC